jgi:hypothetical protein
VRRLCAARELRVDDLVAPRAEIGRRVHPLDEVREPAPAVAEEDALVDDVGAGAERTLGLARGALEVPGLVRVAALDRDDLATLFAEALEVRELVGCRPRAARSARARPRARAA